MDENSNQGWSDLCSSLEERFASGRGGIQDQGVHSRDDLLANLDPAIAASIDNITRLPTDDDYPLWRVRCKVPPIFYF